MELQITIVEHRGGTQEDSPHGIASGASARSNEAAFHWEFGDRSHLVPCEALREAPRREL
ncbi:hypothetical protein [Roseibium polysiphoniae]|uniref:Uncharacterized protein n=1 Tax=Roseibium polysiphoniae TaxID=2571221 RepID=A0ABR9C9A9_9HYPH|nr:hypothetical protein [Roseibium polysiphoniae]MBD8876392.1 hypothetical protein [Roseibium polysiphoniae]